MASQSNSQKTVPANAPVVVEHQAHQAHQTPAPYDLSSVKQESATPMPLPYPHPREDEYQKIASLIPEGTRVLDLGCGDGTLLAQLVHRKGVHGRGIDIDSENVVQCLEKGLSVYQGDLTEALSDYPDQSFDYVVLNQTLQVVKYPIPVLDHMLRVGKHVVLGFPNFAYWPIRAQFLLSGRMPKSQSLPYEWYDTPNIHLFTIKDFHHLCRSQGIDVAASCYRIPTGWISPPQWLPGMNGLAEKGIFVLGRSTASGMARRS